MKSQKKQRIHVQNQHKSDFSTESKPFLHKNDRSYNKSEKLYDSEQNQRRITENLRKSQHIANKTTTYHKTHRHHDFVHPDRTTTGPRQDHDRTPTAKSGPRQDHDRTTTGPRQDHDRYFKPDLGFLLDPRCLPIRCVFFQFFLLESLTSIIFI